MAQQYQEDVDMDDCSNSYSTSSFSGSFEPKIHLSSHQIPHSTGIEDPNVPRAFQLSLHQFLAAQPADFFKNVHQAPVKPVVPPLSSYTTFSAKKPTLEISIIRPARNLTTIKTPIYETPLAGSSKKASFLIKKRKPTDLRRILFIRKPSIAFDLEGNSAHNSEQQATLMDDPFDANKKSSVGTVHAQSGELPKKSPTDEAVDEIMEYAANQYLRSARADLRTVVQKRIKKLTKIKVTHGEELLPAKEKRIDQQKTKLVRKHEQLESPKVRSSSRNKFTNNCEPMNTTADSDFIGEPTIDTQ